MVYLRPETRDAFLRLKAQWKCSYGDVIERLIELKNRTRP